MNIEIANRLVKLRKEKGLSQEDLADKLGISRQSVSKWERAESSPDTDNLICLAKLYGVSLDELLKDDEELEDLAKQQKEKKEQEEKDIEADNKGNTDTDSNETKRTGIHIGDDGIHCYDKDGNAKVSIDDNGVKISGLHIDVSDDDECEFEKFKKFTFSDEKMKMHALVGSIEGALTLLALTGYLLLGLLANDWLNGIGLFFIPFVIGSFIKCIIKKRFSDFNISFLVLSIYLFLGTYLGLWHPLWVLFLIIPVFYSIVSPIDEYRAKKLFMSAKEKKKNSKDDKVIDLDI